MMGLRPFLLFLLFVKVTVGGDIITELPGYSGKLPFTLESGYIQVGEGEVNLFYLFAQSQGSSSDPVLVWLRGGPGCSSLSSFFFEHGPVTFDHKWNGSLPTLVLNKYTWTKNLSIIYLDAPAGSGYSYSTTAEGWLSGDFVFAEQLDQFLRQWFVEHPTLVTNELYLGGSGYTGNQVPIAIQYILDSNNRGISPSLNIKGYIMGNPGTDKYLDFNGRYTFANRLALVSDELYELADSLCSGNFTEPPNESCKEAVDAMSDLTSNINALQVIEPHCEGVSDDVIPESTKGNSVRRFLKEKFEDYLKLKSESSNAPTRWCRQFNHQLCSVWANDKTVQQALYLPEGRTYRWISCNESTLSGPAYDPKVPSVVGYHKNFTKTNLRGLIYSGDHDQEIPYIATQKWIWTLNVPLVKNWSAWFVNNETAGYMRKFSNGNFNLTFTTVKGGGHYAAEYKVEESFEMAKRWLVNDTVAET